MTAQVLPHFGRTQVESSVGDQADDNTGKENFTEHQFYLTRSH